MAAPRFHYIVLAVAATLLFLGLVHQHDQVIDAINTWHGQQDQDLTGSTSSAISPSSPSRPSFKEIALKYGTDKVTDHHYWYMYDKYLEPIREKKLKMLEIGLGCDMNYGPGKSYYTWLEYFPNVDLYYIEYNAVCAETWKHKTTGATIFTGDQGDRAFLQKFVDESGGGFDIIIDDGGHKMTQQRNSLEELWGIVKPGALYFIEDLHTSFLPGWGGDTQGGKDPNVHTMMKFIYELIDDKMVDGHQHAISKEIRGIDCMREVCCIEKMEEGSVS